MQSFVVSQLFLSVFHHSTLSSLQTKESREWNNFLLYVYVKECLRHHGHNADVASLTSHWIWRAIPNYFVCLQLLSCSLSQQSSVLDFFIIIITKVNISLFTSWWHSEIRQENLKINIGISITLYTRRKVAKIEDIWSFLLFKLLSISWRDGKDTRALLFWQARSPVMTSNIFVTV